MESKISYTNEKTTKTVVVLFAIYFKTTSFLSQIYLIIFSSKIKKHIRKPEEWQKPTFIMIL